MYRHCLFCHGDMGVNETVHSFPVGRRLAFDPARGRLWVVCRSCARWNLSPLEERWEALDECERLHRASRLKVATEHIGLSRHPEGLELVRIGPAGGGEFAAWRYGTVLERRRRRRRAALSLGAGAGALVVGVAMTSTVVGAVPGLVVMSNSLLAIDHRNRVRGRYDVRVPTADGPVVIADTRLKEILLTPDRAKGWRLAIPIGGRRFGEARLPSQIERVSLTGEEAVRAAGLVLARMNRSGASRQSVGDAVAFLQQTGAPAEAFTAAAGMQRTWLRYQIGERSLLALPRAVRLGLEMAAHEESERRALEGELAALEQAWKEAEQIAGIADDLLIPASVTRLLQRWRTSSDSGRQRRREDES